MPIATSSLDANWRSTPTWQCYIKAQHMFLCRVKPAFNACYFVHGNRANTCAHMVSAALGRLEYRDPVHNQLRLVRLRFSKKAARRFLDNSGIKSLPVFSCIGSHSERAVDDCSVQLDALAYHTANTNDVFRLGKRSDMSFSGPLERCPYPTQSKMNELEGP
ncbi:hypothetical protein B0H12DRAFT_1222893 [Mycena haematopus]|nr:hypothetical protein B0H12DRAFT_1222893 [Mycena haematopus]